MNAEMDISKNQWRSTGSTLDPDFKHCEKQINRKMAGYIYFWFEIGIYSCQYLGAKMKCEIVLVKKG